MVEVLHAPHPELLGLLLRLLGEHCCKTNSTQWSLLKHFQDSTCIPALLSAFWKDTVFEVGLYNKPCTRRLFKIVKFPTDTITGMQPLSLIYTLDYSWHLRSLQQCSPSSLSSRPRSSGCGAWSTSTTSSARSTSASGSKSRPSTCNTILQKWHIVVALFLSFLWASCRKIHSNPRERAGSLCTQAMWFWRSLDCSVVLL